LRKFSKKIIESRLYSTRQKGSHIRLSKIVENNEHHITIPNHDHIKIGTLSKILNEISVFMQISKEELLDLINR
jgi:predicted RNA binding protein YcfA (HicA-like mRNA interferase family)